MIELNIKIEETSEGVVDMTTTGADTNIGATRREADMADALASMIVSFQAPNFTKQSGSLTNERRPYTVNELLTKLAERYDNGEFESGEDYLSAISKVVENG